MARPGDGGQRIAQVVSLVDVVATICDIAGDDCDLPLDGDSLLPLLTIGDPYWKDEAFCEYLAHGVDRPMAMLLARTLQAQLQLGASS